MAAKAFLSAVAQYLRDRFGGDFQESEGTVAVGTAAVLLVKNDPECVSLTVVNTGTDNVTLGLTPQVASGVGIPLVPGGSTSITVRDDATLPSRAWYAIGASAGQSLYYVKVRRYVTTVLAGVAGG